MERGVVYFEFLFPQSTRSQQIVPLQCLSVPFDSPAARGPRRWKSLRPLSSRAQPHLPEMCGAHYRYPPPLPARGAILSVGPSVSGHKRAPNNSLNFSGFFYPIELAVFEVDVYF